MDHRFKREMPHDSLYNGMVSYWKLEEASGVRADELGTHPLAESTNDPARAVGKHGYAADMEKGDTNQLTRANASAGDLMGDDGSWTFAAWVNPESLANNDRLLSVWPTTGAPNRAYRLVVKSSDKMRLQVDEGGAIRSAETASLSTSTWHHIVAQHNNGTDFRIKLDNAAWVVTSHTAGVQSSNQDFILGHSFDGLIDEAAWWSRSLTDLEIYWLYGNGKPLDLFSV